MRWFVLALALFAAPVAAVQPDEILDDPVLEARARHISAGLRCLVCTSENIDESNATLARDLRLLVRERLVAGDTDSEVVMYIEDRFGEVVRLRPNLEGVNIFLWLAAPAFFLIAVGVGWAAIRRRPVGAIEALSEAEKARVEEILRR